LEEGHQENAFEQAELAPVLPAHQNHLAAKKDSERQNRGIVPEYSYLAYYRVHSASRQ
jgi:hypothetical protein